MKTRRELVTQGLAMSLGLGTLGLLPAARAQFRVEISGVGTTRIPIALPRFRGDDKAPVSISAVVRADLERSGLFTVQDGGNPAVDENTRPVMADWRAAAADALAVGSTTRLADGRFDVRYHLWDVLKGTDQGGLAVPIRAADLRMAGHMVADHIYEKLIGEPGPFNSQIAYVSKIPGRSTLWVADSDGERAQAMVFGPEPIISPAWSPNGKELAYVSFEERKAVVYVQDVGTGKRRMVANYRGSNSAPAWSPDGQQLAVTLTRDGSSQLYTMGRNGENVKRLTFSGAIDTEAVWSADGQSLYFVSDRGGGPQIYRVAASGGAATRITFEGNYNISPAVSPDGRYLAYVSRSGNAFKLMLMDLAGGSVTGLTDTGDDESPSFSPNSRLIMYATKVGGRGVLMTTTLNGRIKATLALGQGDAREPVWGPRISG